MDHHHHFNNHHHNHHHSNHHHHPNNNNHPDNSNNSGQNVQINSHPEPILVSITNTYGIAASQQQHQDDDQQKIPPPPPQQQQHQSTTTQLYNDDEDEANRYTWREYNKKNVAQSNSITPACLLVSVGGIYEMYIYSYLYLYNFHTNLNELSHLIASWFVAVIIGAILSRILIRRIQKTTFNYIASLLTIISGIIFIKLNENNIAIILSNYIAGIAYGLILISVIIHASEISVKKLRGSLVTNIQVCFTIGILVGSILCGFYLNNINILINLHQLCGICIICFSVIAFILNTFMVIESPLYLIDNMQSNDAFKNFLKLRNEKIETIHTRNEFNNLKLMYSKDTRTANIPHLKSLLLIGLLRIIYALFTSIPIYYVLFIYFIQLLESFNIFYILIVIRFISEMISFFMIDRKPGRQHILRISLILSGICSILIGVCVIIKNNNIITPIYIVILSIFYQLFLGLGLGNVSLTYMSEAFTFKNKSNALLFIIGIEHIIHIIIILIFTYQYFNFLYYIHIYFFVIGTISILYTIIYYKKLPETKNCTLRECQNMFR